MGYKSEELYITAKYKSLKDEITNNKIYSLEYMKFSVSLKKAETYMETNRAKTIRSVKYADKRLHYGITAGAELSIEHLFSIILRCDWTELCTKFTSTF